MRRVEGAFWPDYENHLARSGLIYNETVLPDGSKKSYWRDGAYYEFELDELNQIEQDMIALYPKLIEAGDYLIDNGLLGKIGIPEWAWDAVVESWNRFGGEGDPAVYGRFDLRYGGNSALVADDPSLARAKVLEFNADTPTCLVESAVAQYEWFKFMFLGDGSVNQWNDLEEKLVPAWKRALDRAIGTIRRTQGPRGVDLTPVIHFSFTNYDVSGEDLANTRLLEEYAQMAGFRTKIMHVEDIRHNMAEDVFTDMDGEEIRIMFKLHAWEWMCTNHYDDKLHEQFGKGIVRSVRNQSMAWIEPLWKMLWSNKGILPALWAVCRDDPEVRDLLLPAYFADEAPDDLRNYVKKPLLAREGADITIVRDGSVIETGEVQGYGADGFIVQELAPLPNFHSKLDGDHHPVLGVWMAEDDPAGLGIRESDGLITDNLSSFVPHVFKI